MKHIQRLRKMVTLSYHLEWLDNDLFRRWKISCEKKERDFLTAKGLCFKRQLLYSRYDGIAKSLYDLHMCPCF